MGAVGAYLREFFFFLFFTSVQGFPVENKHYYYYYYHYYCKFNDAIDFIY